MQPCDSLSRPRLTFNRAHRLLVDTASTTTPNNQSHRASSSTSAVHSTAQLSRRYSLPALSDGSGYAKSPVYVPVRKRGNSVTELPAAPILAAQRLPSLTDPLVSAWRLSFATDNRGEHLRKLSGHAVPVTLAPERLREKSPSVDRWLHSQGLRSPAQTIVEPEDQETVGTAADPTHQCQVHQDVGGVDGIKDASTEVHLHEMDISKRLANKGLHSSASSPQLSRRGSHQRGASSISNASPVARTERPRHLRTTSDSANPSDHLSDQIPSSWGAVVEHRTSSIYPSNPGSMQHSRENSFFNLLSLFPGGKGRDTPTSRGNQSLVRISVGIADSTAEVSQSLLCLTTSPTANCSSTSLSIPLARHHHHSTHDDSSLLASETASFREREAELSLMEARFASSDAHRTRNSPVPSKFKEEFHVVESEEVREPQARKPSVFNRLATRFTVKSYDGTSKMEELLDIPMPSFDAESLRSPRTGGPGGMLSPGLGPSTFHNPLAELDDSAHLWGRAIKKDGRADRVASNLQLPGRQATVARKKSAVEDDVPKSAFGTIFGGLAKGKKKKVDPNNHKSAAEEYNARFQERLAVKELVLDSWEDEMAATAAKAKTKSRNIVKKSKPTVPDKRFPAAWARFDSDSRVERCISAGAMDRVDVKDFAVLGHKDDGEIIWCLEHDDDGHHAEIEIAREGFRGRVGNKIKHKVYRLDTQDEQSQQTNGRRGSLSVAGELEYPELEVLPFTLRTTEEMEAEIHAEQEFERKKKEEEEQAKRQHIPKLAVRHKVDVDGGVDAPHVDASDGISIADPRFYDDCVVHPGLESKSPGVASPEDEGIGIPTTRDGGPERSVERRAEPSSYGECAAMPRLAVVSEDFGFGPAPGGTKKDKFKTWSGRDWDHYGQNLQRAGSAKAAGSAGLGPGLLKRSRYASTGTMVLRKSTDDYFGEVEMMERQERERVLNVAEVAWGGEGDGK